MIKLEGEHLLPGQIGHFFIILALMSSLVSLISFGVASTKSDLSQKNEWLKFGKINFTIKRKD